MATRPIKKFKLGTALLVRIEVRDASEDTNPLFSPSSSPTILLRDSAGTAAVSNGGMTEEETGVYSYTYQTSTSTSPVGVWRVSFSATSGATTVTTPEVDAFELIP